MDEDETNSKPKINLKAKNNNNKQSLMKSSGNRSNKMTL